MINRYIYSVVFMFTILLAGCGRNDNTPGNDGKGITLKDDLGVQFTFNEVPERTISLAPSLTEMIYSLGVQDRLKGNTLYCTYPEGAKNKIKVGDLLSVDYEKILSLKPDLVLITVEGNVKDTYNKLKALGIRVFVVNPRNFEGIHKSYRQLGKIFRISGKAEADIQDWNRRFNIIQQQVKKQTSRKGMFMVSLAPVMIAGEKTFINEILSACGVINIAAGQPMNYPVFSREEIMKLNPSYIITTGDYSGDEKQIQETYPEWRNIDAVKNRRIIKVDADMYLRPGPRYISALEDLYNKLYQ